MHQSISGRVSAVVVLVLTICNPGGFLSAAGTSTTTAKHSKAASAKAKVARIRDALHRNLDGKGDGFIVGWTFDTSTFVLTVDKRKYQENMVYAATIAARSIFDLEGVRLPKRLVIRDRSGEVLGEGPFSNVPKVVE